MKKNFKTGLLPPLYISAIFVHLSADRHRQQQNYARSISSFKQRITPCAPTVKNKHTQHTLLYFLPAYLLLTSLTGGTFPFLLPRFL